MWVILYGDEIVQDRMEAEVFETEEAAIEWAEAMSIFEWQTYELEDPHWVSN